MNTKNVVMLMVALVTLVVSGVAQATDPATERALFHDIYKELVETNTSHSAGDNTLAAHRVEKRLRDAGFTAAEVQVVEPFPKKGNLVLRFTGDGTRRPLLLLAHLDVVEAKPEEWGTDPFKLVEAGGYFTARGAADDKAMASAFVSILSQLKREGFTPHRDIILALTSDEERGGVSTNGAWWLTQNHYDWIDAEFGINEGGGGELSNGKPNIQRIQVAEKIFTTYELIAHNPGGHSSLPRPDNAVYDIAAAVTRIGQYTFPVKLASVTREYFARSAKLFTGQRAIDMHSIGEGRTDPDTVARLSAEPLYNATLRTTCVTTMLNAGHAENALAQTARATVNCRVLPWDDLAEVDQKVRELVGNPTIEIKQTITPIKSPPSPLTVTIIEPVEQISAEMWPGVPVIPSMSTGATDSLFMRNVGIPMYGVSGIFVDVNDVHAHGLNERLGQTRLYDGREFLYRLIKRLAG
ncbi:MAG TPA: M20/M25/M40 family metallo-hydrolase [Candidatus Binatia bacterium]|jgi:acetylornithine deacetylase/succinyl-diaminopimelate desuccinylase-like protein|nr:M20/M25/M40 family metallo-hydrolase [Candidatus Binatia bacterium]